MVMCRCRKTLCCLGRESHPPDTGGDRRNSPYRSTLHRNHLVNVGKHYPPYIIMSIRGKICIMTNSYVHLHINLFSHDNLFQPLPTCVRASFKKSPRYRK